MIEVRCPQCDILFEAPENLAGKIGGCPACNADVSIPVPASSQVIEVRAEGLNDEEEEATVYEEGPSVTPKRDPAMGTGHVFTREMYVERYGNGSGCCMFGCLGIAAIVFFTIYGVISFFTG